MYQLTEDFGEIHCDLTERSIYLSCHSVYIERKGAFDIFEPILFH